jgi:hypothetical protein
MILDWTPVHDHARPYQLGQLPAWLDDEDPAPAREQLDRNYKHGGGWQPFMGFTLQPNDTIAYPFDPSLRPLWRARLRDETILLYPHDWVAIVQPDRTFEICRMD